MQTKKEPWAKPASASTSSWDEASAESQFHALQASIANMREEMESIDSEKIGDGMLAECQAWQEREALAKSNRFRDQRRWKRADWTPWNSDWQWRDSWKGDSWKSDSWQGKSWKSDSWKDYSKKGDSWEGESKTDDGPGLGQVGEMDVATMVNLLEDVQKKQELVANCKDHVLLMKALGDTVKLQHQIFKMFSEGGPTTAQAQASAESTAPQEPAGPQAPAGAEETTAEDMVPMNAEGECEAVARISQRDLAGCLSCIRASGQQVVVGTGA